VAETVRLLRVVAVSPGDVQPERKAVQRVVDELNRGVARAQGVQLSLWRWETDSHPGLHLEGPQGIVDERMDIAKADVVIGMFWKRFGTPTKEAASGTEHELRRAWGLWKKHGKPDVYVYFSQKRGSPKTAEEADQWRRVREFQDALPWEQFGWSYGSAAEFERLVREHLTGLLLRQLGPSPGAPAGAAPARLRFGIPILAPSFTGREAELAALDKTLAGDGRAVVSQAITGQGGVGKSQLAARYVHDHVDEYEVVAWIRAEDGGTADLAELARKLGEPVDDLSPKERADLALDRLSRGTERWLLVLDNVPSPEQLMNVMPRAGNGRVLVTSRHRGLREFARLLAVDVFDEDTATEYLMERTGRPDDEAGARRVARALGGLPLALSHAGAYCAEGTSFDEYLELLEELPAQELFDRSPEASYAQTVASTWSVSIAAAAARAALAADILAMAAYFGPDGIPKKLFSVLFQRADARARKQLNDAFSALSGLSLVTVDDVSISVHRLLQKTVRDDMRQRGETEAPTRCVTALTGAFPETISLPANWPDCEQLVPHVLALASAFDEPGAHAEELIALSNRACHYLIWADPSDKAVALARMTCRRAQALLGNDHAETLVARNRLAFSLRQEGEIDESIRIFEALVVDSSRVFAEDHPTTLDWRLDLADAYLNVDRTDEAIAILESLIPVVARVHGPESLETLNSEFVLAVAYRTVGRVEDALAMLERQVVVCERAIGAEHPHTFSARHELAVTYRELGRGAEALQELERVRADRDRVLGPDHRHTLAARQAIARSYLAQRRAADAVGALEALLADYARIRGPASAETRETESLLDAARKLAAEHASTAP
jgi:tetratricopeptide (TPR) repeat protein